MIIDQIKQWLRHLCVQVRSLHVYLPTTTCSNSVFIITIIGTTIVLRNRQVLHRYTRQGQNYFLKNDPVMVVCTTRNIQHQTQYTWPRNCFRHSFKYCTNTKNKYWASTKTHSRKNLDYVNTLPFTSTLHTYIITANTTTIYRWFIPVSQFEFTYELSL